MFEKDLMQCRVLRQHPLGVKASIHDSDCSKTAHSTIQMQIYSYESRCKVSNFSVRLTTKFMTEHSLLNTRFPSRSNMRWIKEMHLSRQMWVPLDLLKYLHYTFDLKFWDVNKTVKIDWPCTLALAPRYSDGHRSVGALSGPVSCSGSEGFSVSFQIPHCFRLSRLLCVRQSVSVSSIPLSSVAMILC